MFESVYVRQAKLLLRCLPEIGKQPCFAWHLQELPALQWKLQNIQRMDDGKRKKAFDKLQAALGA